MMTWLMRLGGGLAILPMALALAVALSRRAPKDATKRPLRAALITSLLLFTVGGGIGFLIQGSDVRVPAHYHGSIVGVTLALMGLAYALLPRLGFRAPQGRVANWQPWLYGAGQLLHILGLVWSGGYGVQRRSRAPSRRCARRRRSSAWAWGWAERSRSSADCSHLGRAGRRARRAHAPGRQRGGDGRFRGSEGRART